MIRRLASAFLFLLAASLFAQDFGFGPGGGDDAAGRSGGNFSASVSGEASASIIGYGKDFHDGPSHVNLGDIFSGKLNFAAGVSLAEAFINLNITPSILPEFPITLDEAFVRAYFGKFEIEGGLRKLTWGKADSFGPLDVINPLDYSELTDLSDLMNFKIPRPLVRFSYRFGSFSKLESVFVPNFEPMRFAEEGRWAQAQMMDLSADNVTLPPGITLNLNENKPGTSTIKYAQAGLRFTTTIGSADIGAQYYYGRLTKPAVDISFTTALPVIDVGINYYYNPYHQIGIDWAQVLLGFNIRAEFAANITEDLSGDDPAVYNPHLAWSFGFDRNVGAGINLSLQCNETIRLLNDKIAKDPIHIMYPDILSDMEANTDITSTQIIAAVYRNFFRDQLEVRVAVFWEIEAKDFMLIPSLIWTRDAVAVELSGGIFGGDREGQFGQFKGNSFVKAALTYSF